MPHQVTVGIPVKSSLVNATATVGRALQLPNVSEVILSVSQPHPDDVPGFKSLGKSTRGIPVRVLVAEEPISLFQNLSKVLRAASTDYFSWLCEDDIPAIGLFQSLSSLDDHCPHPALLYPPLEYREVVGEPINWAQVVDGPRLYSLKTWYQKLAFEFEQPAHRIYGIWNREYLDRLFPDRPMDWFDHFLLSMCSLEGRAIEVECPPMVIGVSFPTKVHAVNGRSLSVRGWFKSSFIGLKAMGFWPLVLNLPGLIIALIGKIRAARASRELS